MSDSYIKLIKYCEPVAPVDYKKDIFCLVVFKTHGSYDNPSNVITKSISHRTVLHVRGRDRREKLIQKITLKNFAHLTNDNNYKYFTLDGQIELDGTITLYELSDLILNRNMTNEIAKYYGGRKYAHNAFFRVEKKKKDEE